MADRAKVVTWRGGWPFYRWHYSIRSVDGSALIGAWGSAWSEERALAKADRHIEKIRARRNAVTHTWQR